MRQSLVAGNWKLNGNQSSVADLTTGLKEGAGSIGQAQVAVCPPYLYIAQVQQALGDTAISVGAQDVCDQDSGAFTGEVSAPMLAEAGCRYVIIGHSERRHVYGESDALTAAKFAATKRAGLIPILCVGETLEEREQDITEKVVAEQLDAVISLEGIAGLKGAVIAYEPVWAIGTGKTASPEQAQAVHAFIRSRIAEQDAAIAEGIQILYGGSVKANNAAELFGQADIDGGLIGGASLKSEDFLAICQAAG